MLHDKYLFAREEADLIGSFLTPMLRLQPEKRAIAVDLVEHEWIASERVQGELDVARRRASRDADDQDAMKPVDEQRTSAQGVPVIAAPTARLKENAQQPQPVVKRTTSASGSTHEVVSQPPFPPSITPAK